MDRDQVKVNIDAALDKFTYFEDLIDSQTQDIQDRVELYVEALEADAMSTIARAEAELLQYIALVTADTIHTINKAYFHASPGLMAILAAIWGAIVVVWEFVKIVVNILTVIKELGIGDLLADIWPAFRQARDKFRELVGKLSESLGWGVDGLLHLLHATQGFTDVAAGLTGKSFEWMDVEWMEKTERVLTEVERKAQIIQDNPGDALETIFQHESYRNKALIEPFGLLLNENVTDALATAKDAATGLGGVVSELSAIQDGMPEAIRKNIPQSIWDGLDWADNAINDVVLPRLNKAIATIVFIESQLDKLRADAAGIIDRLAHPGNLLLTVDDLPDYARAAQLAMIDDVASRKFGAAADAERVSISGSIDEFDLIDAALHADTPQPVFLDIESPERAAITGIVAEPLETWMINGFEDQL